MHYTTNPGLTITGNAEPGKPVSMHFASDPGPDDEHTLRGLIGDGATGSGARVKHAYARRRSLPSDVPRRRRRRRRRGGGGGRGRGRRPEGAARYATRIIKLSFPTNYTGDPALTLFIAAETGQVRARRGPRAEVGRSLHGHAGRGDRRDAPGGRAARIPIRHPGSRHPREREGRRLRLRPQPDRGDHRRVRGAPDRRARHRLPRVFLLRAAAVRRPPWWPPPTPRP